MRRIQEKIKDLVDVRPYHSLSNYLSSPNETLQAYHFTSATSELMAKWLDYISDVQPQNGNARALAGYRGVGKSHFLATLGAIAAQPDLRSRIGDQHVTSSAQRLKRRKHPVANVQRGTAETLLLEFRNAVALALETVPTNLPETPREILTLASEFASDVPFVVLIDTAEGRDSRVSRDDGVMLAELADIAKDLNVFIAIALDDDIAGADGVNAAISRSYSIDYLDQEHLYRVVDAYLFPKQRQRQAVFHEIYAGYREAIPSFKWSEQRFSSLYPLHPIVLEIAPFVRLYATDFVLLGFASEAVGKNLGRPANSLITLDEVFDRVEAELRKSELLKDSFVAHDKIVTDVISSIPILQRMQAKMILKALMILSLDSNGATASEISAAMLIYDEAEPQKAINSIEATLFEFSSSLPDDVHVQIEAGKENRYSLKKNKKDTLTDSLTELAMLIEDSAIQKTLRRTARIVFSDWTVNEDAEQIGFDSSECSLIWRGGNRRGKLTWQWGKLADDVSENSVNPSEHLDWEVIIKEPNSSLLPQSGENEIVPTVVWSPAELTKDESDTIKRYTVLQSDNSLTATFGDQIRTSAHSHSALVKSIWKRIFLEDGFLIIDGVKRGFRKDNHEFESLHEMFSLMLSPLFDSRYPEHPVFEKSISMNTVSVLVNELFSEKVQQSDVLNRLAVDFALPLGLVADENGNYVLAAQEAFAELPWSKEINSLLKSDDTVPMRQVYQALKKSPMGLIREAQHLILAAFAGNQELEFVTSTNNRIDKRSLDLKIIWDDIVGIAKPVVVKKDTAELTNWAKLLTGNDSLISIDSDSERIKTDLKVWLDSFRETRVLERFEGLPDNILNTKVWKLSARVGSTFKIVEDAIDGIFSKENSLESTLQRIADIFGHSQNEFFNTTNDLVELEDFILGASQYNEIWNYLALTEITSDPRIEELRGKLLEVIENYRFNFHDDLGSNWKEFRELYAAQYVKQHDIVMRSHNLVETIEQIYQSDEWWEFSNLAKLPIFHNGNWHAAQKLRKKAMSLSCGYDVRELLAQKPFCSCSYRVSETATWEAIADSISTEMNEGRTNYRIVLGQLSQILSPILNEYANRETEPEFSQAAQNLNRILTERLEIPVLDNTSLRVLSTVLGSIPSNAICEANPTIPQEVLNRENIRSSYDSWINSLPGEQVGIRLR
jgi:hypothetical protein